MMAGYKAAQLRGRLRMVCKELPLALECVREGSPLTRCVK
jgi:hypothetical protein